MPAPRPLSPHAARLESPAVANKILAVVRGRVPASEVSDLVQGTYLRALLVPRLPDDLTELVWLVAAIARAVVVDFHRKRARLARVEVDVENPDEMPVDEGPSSARDPLEVREMLEWIEREVERGNLPDEVLRWSQYLAAGATCEEIASREGKSVSAVKVTMHRARKLVHKRWREYLATATVGALLAAMLYVLLRSRREDIAQVPDLPAPTVAPAASVPTPLEQARELRDQAFAACGAQDWGGCLRFFDEAKDRDLPGDADPRVEQARKKAVTELKKLWGRDVK